MERNSRKGKQKNKCIIIVIGLIEKIIVGLKILKKKEKKSSPELQNQT